MDYVEKFKDTLSCKHNKTFVKIVFTCFLTVLIHNNNCLCFINWYAKLIYNNCKEKFIVCFMKLKYCTLCVYTLQSYKINYKLFAVFRHSF